MTSIKVPGDVPGLGKMEHEINKLRTQLKAKTGSELRTILERQRRIVANKSLLSRLPDSGERSRVTILAVERLLEAKDKEEDLAAQMDSLKLTTEAMEWKNRLLDSDDDSDPESCGPVQDPLSLLAEGLVPPPSHQARAKATETDHIEKFAAACTAKVDLTTKPHKFLPHNSVNCAALHEDLRAALGPQNARPPASPSSLRDRVGGGPSPLPLTPSIPLPPNYSCTTKQLSLGESLRLQQEQLKMVKEAQLKQAMDRLGAPTLTSRSTEEEPLKERFLDYREPGEESEQEEEEDSGDEGLAVVGLQANDPHSQEV